MPTSSAKRRISVFWLTSASRAAALTEMRCAGEKLQRQRDGGVMRALPETLRHRAEEDGDLVLRRRRLHNALMQPFGVGAPDIAERDMDVLELARRAAEKGERAARLELHAQHMRLMGVDGEAVRVRAAKPDPRQHAARRIAFAAVPGKLVAIEVDHQPEPARGHDRVLGMAGIEA